MPTSRTLNAAVMGMYKLGLCWRMTRSTDTMMKPITTCGVLNDSNTALLQRSYTRQACGQWTARARTTMRKMPMAQSDLPQPSRRPARIMAPQIPIHTLQQACIRIVTDGRPDEQGKVHTRDEDVDGNEAVLQLRGRDAIRDRSKHSATWDDPGYDGLECNE